jgi:hypothetical protein
LLVLILILLITLQGTGASVFAQQNSEMTNTNGQVLTVSGFAALGDFSQVQDGQSVAPNLPPPAVLARQDYQNLFTQARALLSIGLDFRLGELQLPPSCTGANAGDCQQSYKDFNAGRVYHRYCPTYEEIDPNGYCRSWNDLSPAEQKALVPDLSPERPLTGEIDVRNKLVRAREMFGFLALADPPDLQITVDGQLQSMREVGKNGVLSATREIANIHMIFGNEFMVDALDYRFSGSDPRADLIIAEEIRQLEQALVQFGLAVDTLSHAFNADFGGPGGVRIGDFFGALEFELFGIVSERMVTSIIELADRHRQRGEEELALQLYTEAFTNQYVQAMALAVSAAQRNANFMENGGWEVITNLEGLRARAQAVHEGINPFGFIEPYVPLQTYEELRTLTRNDFLRDSTEDEDRAANAQREFDQNRTALAQELQNLRLTYDSQLLELCGKTNDDFKTCDAEGGLMRQNYHNIAQAADRIVLVMKRLENLSKQVQIEQERNGKVIEITLANGEQMALLEYDKGILGAYHVTEAIVEQETDERYGGAEARSTVSAGINIRPDKWFGWDNSISVFGGYRHSQASTSSLTAVWDPSAIELGSINSAQALQNAAAEAEILNANSAATIKTLMLQQAELMIELEIAVAEFNRLADEHKMLKERYHNLFNLRVVAQDNVANSYLSNPAYRILRDSLTVEAARSHGLGAQFAYLTAKALEYEFLVRYPGLNAIFKARTADDIDNFLNELEAFRVAIGSPGVHNRYPYRISLARDLLGLSDENLNPEGTLSANEVAQRRFTSFQQILQQHVITDTNTGAVIGIELPFTTSLLDNKIFTPNIWNNRIAGVGLPADVPGTKGIALNVVTRQFGDIGTPEVLLTHAGHASYRNAKGEIVHYVPENAKLSGYPVPNGFESKSGSATILASVNGNERGTPSSAFFNRSVAASTWTLRIDLRSPFNTSLDLAQLEDIEIDMDTTGIALSTQAAAAEMDAQQLQQHFDEPSQSR